MQAARGHHFDPQLFDKFLDVLPQFRLIREQVADETHESVRRQKSNSPFRSLAGRMGRTGYQLTSSPPTATTPEATSSQVRTITHRDGSNGSLPKRGFRFPPRRLSPREFYFIFSLLPPVPNIHQLGCPV